MDLRLDHHLSPAWIGEVKGVGAAAVSVALPRILRVTTTTDEPPFQRPCWLASMPISTLAARTQRQRGVFPLALSGAGVVALLEVAGYCDLRNPRNLRNLSRLGGTTTTTATTTTVSKVAPLVVVAIIPKRDKGTELQRGIIPHVFPPPATAMGRATLTSVFLPPTVGVMPSLRKEGGHFRQPAGRIITRGLCDRCFSNTGLAGVVAAAPSNSRSFSRVQSISQMGVR